MYLWKLIGVFALISTSLSLGEPKFGTITLPGEKSRGDIASWYEKYKDCVVTLKANGIIFTGTVVAWKEGWSYVATYWFRNFEIVPIQLLANSRLEAIRTEVVGEHNRIVLLRVKSEKPKSIPEIDFSDQFKVGSTVYSIGNHRWETLDHTLIKAFVSAKNRNIDLRLSHGINYQWNDTVQLQGPFAHPHSNAIFSPKGKIIGFLGFINEEIQNTIFGTSTKNVKPLFCSGKHVPRDLFSTCKK